MKAITLVKVHKEVQTMINARHDATSNNVHVENMQCLQLHKITNECRHMSAYMGHQAALLMMEGGICATSVVPKDCGLQLRQVSCDSSLGTPLSPHWVETFQRCPE
jgi:hypothetical protein